MSIDADGERRGRLRVYLGAAPGVGKTFAMLGEGHRRLGRGQDVVIGYLEDHDRPRTREAASGLPALARLSVDYRGSTFHELDVAAVIARRPSIVLIDELAHTNIPGTAHQKRWQDVEQILAAGIDVITTVNVQHLESLNDEVTSITGITQRETVPDRVVRLAAQIELVDMSPDSLRRRLAHGNIYRPEKIDAALSNYFRIGNLTALRELALLWLADRVDDALLDYRNRHAIAQTWPARERIVVALTGGTEGESLIRRAARIAAQSSAADLLAVYVVGGDHPQAVSPGALEKQRRLVEDLGGSFHEVLGDEVAQALLEFARGTNATQLVLGSSRRGRLRSVLREGVGPVVVRESGDIDVHIVTHEHAGKRSWRGGTERAALSLSRIVVGWVSALLAPALLTVVLRLTAQLHQLPTEVMLYLSVVVAVAIVGGLWPALTAAVVGTILLNYYFAPPLHTLTIAAPQNIFVLVVFLLVGAAVAIVVDQSARRSAQAITARGEADALGLLARSVLRGEAEMGALLERVRTTFAAESVSLLENSDDEPGWRCVASAGDRAPDVEPEDASAHVQINDHLALALRGPMLAANQRRLLEAFAVHAAGLIERERLSMEAAAARRAAEGNNIRVSLLAAVSHDLRTPLSSIKAAAATLRQPDITLSAQDRAELLADIDKSTDRLDGLIGNLLDMSRLQTGVVKPMALDLGLDEVIPLGVVGLAGQKRVTFDLPEDLPRATADPGLLERVIANIVENALKYSGQSRVRISASAIEDRVEIRVADNGRGVPDDAKAAIFEPFQRAGDSSHGNGVGLGLAVARGFVNAMGGTLEAEDTPGGGLTMVIALPLAASESSALAQSQAPPVTP
ncbi:two-component system sensor histidine kinase KdpD [Antricoccus suffuscus]|uniref:histidine kinase n=1 Tax=Antricoccus suffuscus TaxID=1629062 RepID=A0A2T0ZC16_9ACTN|nr:ATP-binding protein [Antricoccus suffuscus]PRZ33900.1 two-component system sensor histidine kinase KdpD [Antricoccus suffuscus]